MNIPDETVNEEAVIAEVAADAANSDLRVPRWARSVAIVLLLLATVVLVWILAARARPQALGVPVDWHGTTADWCGLTADTIALVAAVAVVMNLWCISRSFGNALSEGRALSALVSMATAAAGSFLCLLFIMLAAYSLVADSAAMRAALQDDSARPSLTVVAAGRPFLLALVFAVNGASALWLRKLANVGVSRVGN